MKRTMNQRDVAKFHRYLEEGISIEKISKGMGIEKATLNKFTPQAIAKATGAPIPKAAEKPVKEDK